MAKKEFVSNVTGEEWRKEYLKQWKRVINQVGVVIEDEIHNAKHNTTITLKAGTKVIIDDIRGRIKPQYRVRDENGKIWFVGAHNIDFSSSESTTDVKNVEKVSVEPIYRGGVRIDDEVDNDTLLSKRFEMPDKSTVDELREAKEQKLKEQKKENG
jgi:hypothetical protein